MTKEVDNHRGAPLAVEAVRRIDAIFAIEAEITGRSPEERLAARQSRIASLIADLEAWMRSQRARLSCHSHVVRAMDYMLKRWTAFTGFLDDGRICLTDAVAERALRSIAVGHRNWHFAGCDRGGERAAAIYALIATAWLNEVDPQAWLADVLCRINDHPVQQLSELLPWNWRNATPAHVAAA